NLKFALTDQSRIALPSHTLKISAATVREPASDPTAIYLPTSVLRERVCDKSEGSIPVDIVYTWVDGNDPLWIKRKNNALRETLNTPQNAPSAHPNSTDPARYLSSDELRYSLRSVYQFA